MSAAAVGLASTPEALPSGVRSAMLDRQHFELVARLAGFWARPVAFVDPSHLAIGPLGAKSVTAMDQNLQFRSPINASVGEALGLDRKAPDAAFLDQMVRSAACRIVILLLTAPLANVHRVGLALSAAILSRRISGLIMKTDRARAREALGPEAFQIAVEEAPLMYGSLSDLDLKASSTDPLRGDGDNAGEMQLYAEAVLGRLCDAIAPALTDVFALRFPADALFDGRARVVGGFTPAQVDLSLRMIRRKEASWLATIA